MSFTSGNLTHLFTGKPKLVAQKRIQSAAPTRTDEAQQKAGRKGEMKSKLIM